MADTPKVYVICDQNCKFESMTKEQILTAIMQAVNEGTIGNIDTGFITTLKTVNNVGLKFFYGSQAEYNALSDKDKEGLFAVITDDTSIEGINKAIETLQKEITQSTTSLQKDIENLQKEISQTIPSSAVTSLQNDVANLKTKTTNLQNNVTSLQNDVANLEDNQDYENRTNAYNNGIQFDNWSVPNLSNGIYSCLVRQTSNNYQMYTLFLHYHQKANDEGLLTTCGTMVDIPEGLRIGLFVNSDGTCFINTFDSKGNITQHDGGLHIYVMAFTKIMGVALTEQITFYLNDNGNGVTGIALKCEEGMTWSDYIRSAYNPQNNIYVTSIGNDVYIDNTQIMGVSVTDTITSGATYDIGT